MKARAEALSKAGLDVVAETMVKVAELRAGSSGSSRGGS